MSWLFLTFISAILAALSRILQKKLLDSPQVDSFAFSVIFQVTVSLLFLLYVLATGTFELPNLRGLELNLIGVGVLYSLGNIFIFNAFKYAEASEVSIIFSSTSIWAVVAAMLLLGERPTLLNFVGISLIIAGIAVINFKKSTWKLGKGHIFALLSAMFFGFGFINDAFILSRYTSVASYLAVAFSVPAVFSALYRLKSIKNIPHFFSSKKLGTFILMCVVYAGAAISIFTAFKVGGPASIISPIQNTNIILTVLLSYFLLQERDNLPLKILGSVLAFAGVLLVL